MTHDPAKNHFRDAAKKAPETGQPGSLGLAHGSASWPCPNRCLTWARCTPIERTHPMPHHHPKCEHYNASLIDVWRVSHDGTSYVTDSQADAEEVAALYGEDPDSAFTVTREKMHREVYDNLPEFDGF